MHSDEGASDVDACVGADLLHRDGVFELLPTGGGPAAARMGTRHDADFLPAVFLSGFPFNNDRPVEVLTALCGQPDAVFSQHRCDAGIDSLCSLKARVLADVAADDLAGRAAHHKDVALFQLCLGQQLRHSLPRFGLDLLFELFRHKKTPRFILLQTAGWQSLPRRNTLCFPPGTPPCSRPALCLRMSASSFRRRCPQPRRRGRPQAA